MENEKVIIKIELEQEDALKQITQNTKSLLELRAEQLKLEKQRKEVVKELEIHAERQAELNKELESGKLTTEQHTKVTAELKEEYVDTIEAQDAIVRQMVKVKMETKALTDDNRNLTKAMELSKTVDTEKEGSLKQLRAQLIQMKKAVADLSKEERENTEAGKLLVKQTGELNEEVKAIEKSYGDNQRSVGDYTGGILKAVDGTGFFTKATETLTEAQEVGNRALTAGKVAINKFKDAQGGAQKASVVFGLGLRALSAIPIILFFSAIVALVTKTQAGMNFLERTLAGVSTALTVLVDGLAKLGDGLVKLVQNPMRLFTDFGGVVNDLKIDVGELAANAVRAGIAMADLTRELQDIDDAQRDLNVANADAERQITRLMLQAKNRGLSEKERLKILDDASRIEKKAFDEQYAMEVRRMKNLVERNNLERVNGELSDEQLQAEADQMVKLILLDQQSAELTEKITNRRSQLLIEERENRAKAAKEAEDRRKKASEKELREMKAQAELWLEQAEKGSEAELEFRVNLLKTERDIALKNKDLTESERLLITQKALSAEMAMRKEFAQKALDDAQKLLEAEKKQAEDFKKRTDTEYSEQQKSSVDFYAEQTLALTNALAERRITEEQYLREIERLKSESLQRQLQDAIDYGKSTVAIEQQQAEQKIAIAKREALERQAVQEAQLEFAGNMLFATGELLSLAAQSGEDAAEFEKAMAVFQLTVDSVKAISNIIELATAPTADNLATGGLAVPIKIAALSGVVLANINQARKMLTAEAPKAPGPRFSQGGILDGPSHAQGGIQLYSPKGAYFGEAEGGEPILTAAVSRNPSLLAAASQINVAAGGAPLIPRSHMADGGIIRQGMAGLQNSDLALSIATHLAKIIPTSISVKQIDRGLKTQARVRNSGKL